MSPSDRDKKAEPLRVRPVSPPETIPVFNCVVYLRRGPEGYCGRVANAEGIEVSGKSEREVLQQVVGCFKRLAAEAIAEGRSPILDKPMPPDENETVRYVAVHL